MRPFGEQSKLDQKRASESGFTLLEVILTLSILLSLSIAATNMMRGSIDMRQAVGQQSAVTHRLSIVMEALINDLEHAYLIPKQKPEYNYIDRATKTIFRIRRDGQNNELSFTTMSHHTIVANAHEGDGTYVVYKIMDDPDVPGRSNLYRGESKVIPENFRDEIPMRLLAKDIKSLKLLPWDGDRFLADLWDTDRSDYKDMLPQMIKVDVEAWEEEAIATESRDSAVDEITAQASTIVYLPRSFGLAEKKARSQNIRWY